MKVVENEILPIELQIENNDSTKFPRAILRDESNFIIANVDLNHVNEGLYKPGVNFSMTSAKFISVQYLIFDDASRTVQSIDVGSATEVFIRESVHELTWDEQTSNHTIPGSTGETLGLLEALDLESILSKILISDIIARVESDEVTTANVESELNNVIASSIENEQIFVAVGDADEIKSNIDGNGEIIGVTNEC